MTKDSFRGFISNLAKVISVIKEKSGKIVVPVAIHPTPLNIQSEMVVIMKEVGSLTDSLFLGERLPEDINKLAAKF